MAAYSASNAVRSPTYTGGQYGFTLVEVMVAVTVLSLVMLATTTGLRTLANTQVAIERMTARVDDVRSVSSFLRDTLQSTVIGDDAGGLTLGGGGQGLTFFRASPNAVELESIVLFGEGYGGSYLIRVAQESDQLVLRWLEPGRHPKPQDWEGAPSRVLVNDLDELKVAYRREFSGDWLDQWDRQGVPELLRLQIKASGRYWPDLILRPQP
ncbi:MAG: general secretion pathway protein GspJ [Gammaproteobacteria bacterium]|nr:MAG: general secretion pathway protein GspJ [Gammaproteobacteria bacterium]RLA60210.1 MAG: general secretion pathway protein GspJ [Gammaproteobacteria bacterium]